jgi:hypothetical protein
MKNKAKIGSILKGQLFDAEILAENKKLIFFIVALAFISAYSSHSLDKKIYKVSNLQKEVRELKSEFVSVRTELMSLRLGSTLQESVKERGLEPSTVPPHIIRPKKQ